MLGCAFPLLLSTPAWADHTYNVNFSIEYLPNGSALVIKTPQGYAPNSDCMTTWQVPPLPKCSPSTMTGPRNVAVSVNGKSRYLSVQITDKNSVFCSGSPKYNTWEFTIYGPGPASSAFTRKGKVVFSHKRVGETAEWATKIIASNTDGVTRNSYVSRVTCDSGLGKLENCLNREVKGENAGNNIWI